MAMRKNTFFYLMIFAVLTGLQSCATDQLLKSYIVGPWQPVKAGSLDIKKLFPMDDTLPHQYTEEDYKMLTDLKQNLSKAGVGGTSQKSTMKDFNNMVTEIATSYKFTKEGIGARDNPAQPCKGKWKLKKKGTMLVLTDFGTKEKFILLIDSLSSKKMVATNKNLPKGLKITYIKGQTIVPANDGTPSL
jgi:hypothetical protein